MQTKYEYLSVEKSGITTAVTLNRPTKMNPLSPRMLVEFKDVLAGLRASTCCRFVIFTGAGKALSCGAELSEDAFKAKTTMPGLNSERLW